MRPAASSRRPSTTAAQATRTTRSARSCTSPGRSGTARTRRRPASRSPRARCSSARAVHDNHNLHVASMGFWIAMFVRDDSVQRCGPMPDDVVEINRPKRFDRTPDHDLVVPQLARPRGPFRPFDGGRSRSATTSSARGGSRPRRGDGHVELRRAAAALGHGGERAARVLVDLLGPDARQLQRHAAGAGHLQAHLPGAPDADGADARGRVAASAELLDDVGERRDRAADRRLRRRAVAEHQRGGTPVPSAQCQRASSTSTPRSNAACASAFSSTSAAASRAGAARRRRRARVASGRCSASAAIVASRRAR